MCFDNVQVWVDDAQDINFRYPGADATPSIFVSIDGESRSESYENLFVLGDLGAIADIPTLAHFLLKGSALEDWLWEKIDECQTELLDAITA